MGIIKSIQETRKTLLIEIRSRVVSRLEEIGEHTQKQPFFELKEKKTQFQFAQIEPNDDVSIGTIRAGTEEEPCKWVH